MSAPSDSRKGAGNTTSTQQRIKAVVRKLPPNLPEDIFWRSCELWVNDNTVRMKWFRKGDLKGPRMNSRSLMSRAYIAFKTPEELATFSQNFDGHVFKDKQGNEYSAIVEFAPSQKLPLANPKADTRQGTIEEDEGYKSFLELLEKGENPSKEKAPPQVIMDSSKPESTPLLESLITAKGHGFKSSKHKVAHLHAAKNNRTQEDDAHFSRAQPIVPSGPVTLLTSTTTKAESSKAAQPPTSAAATSKISQGKTTAETPVKGKGKGKANAQLDQPPVGSSPSKPPKSKGGNVQRKGTSTDAGGGTAEKEHQTAAATMTTKEDPNGKKVQGHGKKKKPIPPPDVGESTSKSDTGVDPSSAEGNSGADAPAASTSTTSTTTRDGPRERGRGRPGRGRGGLVLVPKILTKIITEGSSNPSPPSKHPQRSHGGEASASASGSTGDNASNLQQQTDGTIAPSNAAVTKETFSSEEGGAAPSSAPPLRGGERGRRPFYRSRGRGRGRGVKPEDGAS